MDTKTKIELADLILKVIAGILAAAWALYLLRLIHRPLAQAGLLKSKIEFDDYQQRKSLLGGLALSLQATAHQIPGSANFAIFAVVDITNRTESHVFRIQWTDAPLHVWVAKFDPQGSPTYKHHAASSVRRTSDPNSPAMPLRVRPGATESLSFAVGVSTPGIYLVTFRIPIEPKYLDDVKKLGMEMPGTWTRKAHVVVGNTPEPVPLRSDQHAPV